MTNAILILGVGLVVALGVLMTSRAWRLPALMFGLLAIPGNVDDLLPQMRLDPNDIANNTMAAVSVVDLLLVWAVLLTLREGRPTRVSPPLLRLAGILALLACATAAMAVARGVEPSAAVRGAIVFLRIIGVLYLAGNLITSRGDVFRLALGTAVGGVILLANGLYTSTTLGQDRFTASTFGRNTFAIALVIIAIASAGIAFEAWGHERVPRRRAAVVAASALIATAALFGAVATGTRMSLVALTCAGLFALLANRSWASPVGIVRVGAISLLTVAIIGASASLSTMGSRTVSIITSPETTIQAVTDSGSLPAYSEIRSREDFWNLAIQMAIENPVAGVGPFQWNIQRYRYAPYPPLVADTHDSYLQIGAEFGVPVAALYLLLLGSCMTTVILAARNRKASAPTRADWTTTALAAGAIAFMVADITNSNLFHVRLGLFGWLLIAIAVVSATRSRQNDVTDPTPVITS